MAGTSMAPVDSITAWVKSQRIDLVPEVRV